MARDLTNEPALPTASIQGDILVGLLKRHEHLIFFRVVDDNKFKNFLQTLHVTSMQECLDQRKRVSDNKEKCSASDIPTPGLNVAFTFSGLHHLGVSAKPATDDLMKEFKPFADGMQASGGKLSDPPASSWRILRPDTRLHGVFIVTGSTHAEVVDVISLRLATQADNGWQMLHEEVGQIRPLPVKGHEHFGFADGVSQPGVRGTIAAGVPLTPQAEGAEESQGQRGQDLLWPGEFVFGYPGQDPEADSFETKGEVVAPPISFMENGAFLVFRRLAQEVPEFHHAVRTAASSVTSAGNPMNPDLLGAQMVGRWKSGAPIIKAQTQDDLSIADGTAGVNDFEFGEDRKGLVCPWAAHIRKAYPRDDVPFNPDASDETEIKKSEAFTQAHRMLRRGITFGPELTEKEALDQRSAGGSQSRGLLFKCYVTSILDQFEFVQQQWCNNGSFSQEGAGIDPIIGQSAAASRPFLGAAPVSRDAADKPQLSFQSFVHLEGGGYFFAPSIDALRTL